MTVDINIKLQNLEIGWIRDLRIGGLLSGIYNPQKNVLDTVEEVHKILNANEYTPESSYIPVLLPAYPDENSVYTIDESLIAESLFRSNNKYIGNRNFMAFGNRFLNAMPSITKRAQAIRTHNDNVRKFVSALKSAGTTVCAFQTRNIPHNGHIKIIHHLLEICDHVIINPVVGIKKPGDTLMTVLEESYQYVIDNILPNSNLYYMPVFSDMYYAGPKEAAHHALIRQNLGFTHFSVGRDHAGAENLFPPEAAVNFMTEIKSSLHIKVFTIPGAYYCTSCKKVTILDCCEEYRQSISKQNISGTECRKAITNGTPYKHLDEGLISHLVNNFKKDLFES